MDAGKAQTAGQLDREIKDLTDLVSRIQTALSENWIANDITVQAPETGASRPAGTLLQLLPIGPASQDLSQLCLKTALDTYQTQLADLQGQLNSL